MLAPRTRGAAWALALLLLAGPLAVYSLWVTMLATSVGLLIVGALPARQVRRGWLDLPAFALLGTVVSWQAFCTVPGYFWLNRVALAALARALADAPAVTDLSLGQDGRIALGSGAPDFDDYRFLNGTLVTHYPDRARPAVEQPVVPIDDALRGLGVPRAQYDGLRRLMVRAGIGYATRDPASGVVSMSRIGEDNEWDSSYVFSPRAGRDGMGLPPEWQRERLAPHWFLARHL